MTNTKGKEAAGRAHKAQKIKIPFGFSFKQLRELDFIFWEKKPSSYSDMLEQCIDLQRVPSGDRDEFHKFMQRLMLFFLRFENAGKRRWLKKQA